MVAPAVNHNHTKKAHKKAVPEHDDRHQYIQTKEPELHQTKLHLTKRANDDWTDWLRTVRLTTGYIN